ncbi:MAG: TetR/AcrR family transcriptional regulator [Chitinispirillaceae bacterium]|nr:TetR/AcrR family transcriptional regulator [Chitinispirillaceae bacterium]
MDETRKKILEAAEKLIVEHGWENVTFRMITSEAGVNLAAINYHFGSKEDLEDALLQRIGTPLDERRIEMLEEAEKRAFPKIPDVETIIRCFLEPLIEFSQNYPNYHKLIQSFFSGIKDKNKIINYFKTNINTLNTRFIEAFVKALPDVPPEKIKINYAILFASSHLLWDNSPFICLMESLGLKITKENFLEEIVSLFCTAFNIEKGNYQKEGENR